MADGPTVTPAEKEALLSRSYEDPVFFCRYFLSHLFPTEMPWFHRGILAILTRKCAFLERYGDIEKIISNFTFEQNGVETPVFFYRDGQLCMSVSKFTLLIIPRGYSKTTIAGIAVPVYDILFQDQKVLVYVSESSTHSEMQLDNVKRELEGNELIKLIFGAQKSERADAGKWRADLIETKTEIVVGARGRGAQIRGFNHKGNRPSKIIVDDVEDKESVSTELQRVKTRTWAYGDLMPALSELNPNSTIVALGTVLHKEALLCVWAKDPQWTVIRFGAYDKDGDLLWPLMMDEKKLAGKKASYAQAGQLSTFYLEYFNEPRDPESAPFKDEWLENAKRDAQPKKDEPIMHAVYLDPAISPKRLADHAVLTVAGICADGRIYVKESIGKIGMAPREQIDLFFQLHKAYGCYRAGIESNAFQAAMIHLVQEEMARLGYWFEVEPVQHKTKKEERILGVLVPRYANGYVKHTKAFSDLETQMLDFRRGADQKDDYVDSLAGCVALLDPYAGVVSEYARTKLPELEEWRPY